MANSAIYRGLIMFKTMFTQRKYRVLHMVAHAGWKRLQFGGTLNNVTYIILKMKNLSLFTAI